MNIILNNYEIILLTTSFLIPVAILSAAYKKGGLSKLKKFSQNGLYFGLFAGLLFGFILGIIGWTLFGLASWMITSLIIWISVGLLTGWNDEFRGESRRVIKGD